jgi:quinol monooxygenase YgiN
VTLYVMVEMTAKKGSEAGLLEACRRHLPTTRAQDGCQSLELTTNMDDPDNMLIVMRWQSRKHYDTYLAWRQSIGDVKRFSDMTEGGLSIRFFEVTDV